MTHRDVMFPQTLMDALGRPRGGVLLALPPNNQLQITLSRSREGGNVMGIEI